MKGAYLTMLKRRSSTFKTLVKSKPISHLSDKKTVKKMTKSIGRSIMQCNAHNEIVMKDRMRNSLVFSVFKDKQLFESRVAIPTIEMEYDNDNESEWMEIEDNVRDMTLSLSIAAFDRTFRK